LAQEEHFADQRVDLLHLAACLLDQLERLDPGKRRRLEQGRKARERRPQLVRDGGGESRPQLLVGGEVARRAQVEQRLLPPVDLVRDRERDGPALEADELRRQRLSLLEPLERLARATARADDALLLVEHDHDLTALLDQDASAL